MAKKMNEFVKSDVQQVALENADDKLKKYLRELAKKSVHTEVDKKKTFSSLRVVASVLVANAKQNLFKKAWNREIATSLHDEAPKPTKKPVLRLYAQYIGISLAAGMALGAMISFAIVGGAIPIAALYGGITLAVISGAITTEILSSHHDELNKANNLGSALAKKTSEITTLKKEKGKQHKIDVAKEKQLEATRVAEEERVLAEEKAQSEELARAEVAAEAEVGAKSIEAAHIEEGDLPEQEYSVQKASLIEESNLIKKDNDIGRSNFIPKSDFILEEALSEEEKELLDLQAEIDEKIQQNKQKRSFVGKEIEKTALELSADGRTA